MEPYPSIPHRSDVITACKEHGGSVAAVLPIHYPRALLRVFDILPVEVWGPPSVQSGEGDEHLQSYVCSIVRNSLSFLLNGGLKETDFLVIPHTCDSMQGLASLLIDFIKPDQVVIPIYLPRGFRSSDTRFLAAEFELIFNKLAAITSRSPRHDELLACIKREEEADRTLADLHNHHRYLMNNDAGFYRLIRSREYLPAETFIELVRKVIATSQERNSSPDDNGFTPVLISGIVPEPMQVFEVLNELGATVAADDLANCGRRLYPAGQSGDPFLRMAEILNSSPPDPTRGSSIEDRLDHLLRLSETSGAEAVIFFTVKFCEPELFDLPNLREGLKKKGIPSITIETDLEETLPLRTRTNLEAFMETIR